MKRKELAEATQRCRAYNYRAAAPGRSYQTNLGRCRNKVSFHCETYPYFVCKKHLKQEVATIPELKFETIEDYYIGQVEQALQSDKT